MSTEELESIRIGAHEFVHRYLKKPTWCGICTEFIVGVTPHQQNAYKCQNCKLVGHHHCLEICQIECVKKKVEFSDITDQAMKTYMGTTAQKAGQVRFKDKLDFCFLILFSF